MSSLFIYLFYWSTRKLFIVCVIATTSTSTTTTKTTMRWRPASVESLFCPQWYYRTQSTSFVCLKFFFLFLFSALFFCFLVLSWFLPSSLCSGFRFDIRFLYCALSLSLSLSLAVVTFCTATTTLCCRNHKKAQSFLHHTHHKKKSSNR